MVMNQTYLSLLLLPLLAGCPERGEPMLVSIATPETVLFHEDLVGHYRDDDSHIQLMPCGEHRYWVQSFDKDEQPAGEPSVLQLVRLGDQTFAELVSNDPDAQRQAGRETGVEAGGERVDLWRITFDGDDVHLWSVAGEVQNGDFGRLVRQPGVRSRVITVRQLDGNRAEQRIPDLTAQDVRDYLSRHPDLFSTLDTTYRRAD